MILETRFELLMNQFRESVSWKFVLFKRQQHFSFLTEEGWIALSNLDLREFVHPLNPSFENAEITYAETELCDFDFIVLLLIPLFFKLLSYFHKL